MATFNLKKFAEDEGHRRDRIQRKIVEFFHDMEPVDSNAYISPEMDKVMLSLGDTHSGEYDKFTKALRKKLKGEDIEVEDCDECGCPEDWTAAFSLFGGFAKRTVLTYACTGCGHRCNQDQASQGCPKCKSSLFRVARRELPLIQQPQYDPYRAHDNQEDGYKMTTPGGEGDISGSGFGQNSRQDPFLGNDVVGEYHDQHDNHTNQNRNLPMDQDAFDPNGNPEPDSGSYSTPLSPALTDDDSPINPLNYKEPKHTGPHNMPHQTAYNGWRGQDVYDRIRRRTKGR